MDNMMASVCLTRMPFVLLQAELFFLTINYVGGHHDYRCTKGNQNE